MLRVKMKKIEAMHSEGETPEAEVLIQVTINTPQVGVEPYLGIFFKNAPEVVISETTLKFSEMRSVMSQHKLKNWDQVKNFIEEKYTEYYLRMFQEWDIQGKGESKKQTS